MFNVGWFPAVVDGDGIITGEVHEYSNTDLILKSMDAIESEGSLYERVVTMATYVDNSKQHVFVYKYLRNTDGLKKVESNTWKI